jgi:hypothetical protein
VSGVAVRNRELCRRPRRYTKKELGKRYAGLFIGQQLGNGFGGLIAAGVLKMDGVRGIAGWRWLFIM